MQCFLNKNSFILLTIDLINNSNLLEVHFLLHNSDLWILQFIGGRKCFVFLLTLVQLSLVLKKNKTKTNIWRQKKPFWENWEFLVLKPNFIFVSSWVLKPFNYMFFQSITLIAILGQKFNQNQISSMLLHCTWNISPGVQFHQKTFILFL